MVVSQGWMCECVLGWASGSVGDKPGIRIGVCTPAFGSASPFQLLPPSLLPLLPPTPTPQLSWYIDPDFVKPGSSLGPSLCSVTSRTEKLTAASVSPSLKRFVKPVFLTRLVIVRFNQDHINDKSQKRFYKCDKSLVPEGLLLLIILLA